MAAQLAASQEGLSSLSMQANKLSKVLKLHAISQM
jgi:hypothetical protein